MSNINLGQAAQSLYVGRTLDNYTGVVIHAGQDSDGDEITFSAGNSTGYVLEIDNPIGTQAMAYAILSGLKLRGVRYQPLEANGALLDPSSEIGDAVTVNGVNSVILTMDTKHTRLMSSNIASPYDEEVDHEYQYKSNTQREFKRESAYARSRISQNATQIQLEVARATTAEGGLSSRITIEADRITAEVARATGAESGLSSRITLNANSISSEVARAINSEITLSTRITQNEDSITAEVTRATGAEGTLSTRIDQRLDSITLSVSSASGSSTFTIKDGSTTLDTKTLDLSVKAVNISGKLTVGQLADGSVVTSSKTETEYYLSTSASSATGGSWSTTVPNWESGKYIWTRQKTTDTRNDGTTNVTYSPQNGAYDKNLTNALSTASSASSAASTATKRTSVIYRSMSGGSAPSAPSSWVTDVTGGQNTWTLIRPEYSSSYPALYIAQQSETVGGTYSCSTPKIDATTTVIDGSHIITGTIDASKISVNNLQAISATLAGWTLMDTSIRKTISNTSSVQLNAPASPSDNDNAFVVTTYVNNAWQTQIAMKYGGLLYARNAQITGQITATSGVIGGVSISNGVLTGIQALNIADNTITNGKIADLTLTDAKIASNTITNGSMLNNTLQTGKMSSGINTNLGYGAAYGEATSSSGSASSMYKTSYLVVGGYGVRWAQVKGGDNVYRWTLIRDE